MGKVLKIIAVIAIAAAIAYFAPALTPHFLSAALGASAATAAVGAALTIAATAVLTALTAAKPSATGANTPSVYRQTIANSIIIYGKRRVGGLLIFFHPVGSDYRYFVIAAAGHRCQGVTRWFLNDEVVTVDGSGKVTSGTYANNCWLWFMRGTDDQVAHPTFVAETQGKWTANHRGCGTALIYAKFKMIDAVVQAGMPNITAEIEGKDDVRDPRDDSVGYTRNAALVFYDWMALPREQGGFGAYPDELDDDWIAAQAQEADDPCPLPDGTNEPRYEFDSYIQTGAAPSEVRDTFVTCCAGAYTYSGGKHLMRVGQYVSPSATLKEQDLAGSIVVPAMLSDDETANEISGTYIEPNMYQSADVPTRSIDADDVRQKPYDLPHITSIHRGQRLLEYYLRKAQAERRVTWPMNIMGIAISTLDTVQLATSRYGLSNYSFQVTSWGLAADFSVGLQLEEHNPEMFEFGVDDYLTVGATGELVRAVPISDAPSRGAHQITGYSVEYPLTSTATSISVAAFTGRLDDNRLIDFPAYEVDGLTDASNYIVFYALEDYDQPLLAPDGTPLAAPDGTPFTSLTGAGTYLAVPKGTASLDALGNSSLAVVRAMTTATSDGTYPPAQTPPAGDGGTGYGAGGKFQVEQDLTA